MYPKTKFKISVKKDVDTLLAFTKDAEFDGGENLNGAIFRLYPDLKKYFNENKIIDLKSLERFIKLKYKKEGETIEKNLEIYKNNWEQIETKFFNLIDEFFKEKYWPKGKYIAYPTIWGMYPRFLEDKTFQVPYKFKNKKYVNVVIAHELLHFVFYGYFLSKYPQYKKGKYNFLVWNASEIFNEIIQNSPKWLKIFKIETMGYPMHEKIVKKLGKIHYKNIDVNVGNLIEDILKEAKGTETRD